MATCLTISGGISRVILVIVNASGLVFALTLIAFTSDLRVSPDDNSLGQDYESTEKALLVSIVSGYTPAIDTAPISAWHLRDADIFNTFFLSMWLGGGILLIISVVGLIMAAKKSSGGLIVHAGFLVILLIGQIALYSMFSDNSVGNLKENVPLHTSIQGSMYTSFKDYGGVYETDANSIGWSFIMLKYDCCGVYGWTQYDTMTTNLNIPIRIEGQLICCERDMLALNPNASCWSSDVHSSDKQDCYTAVVKAILSSTFVQCLPVIYIVQFVMVMCAIMIVLDNKYTVSKVEPEKEDYPDKRYTPRPLSEKRVP